MIFNFKLRHVLKNSLLVVEPKKPTLPPPIRLARNNLHGRYLQRVLCQGGLDMHACE
jgi:hypothetical protein